MHSKKYMIIRSFLLATVALYLYGPTLSAADYSFLNDFRADHGLPAVDSGADRSEVMLKTAKQLRGDGVRGIWENWVFEERAAAPDSEILSSLKRVNKRNIENRFAPYIPRNPIYVALQKKLVERRGTLGRDMKGFRELPSPTKGEIVKVGQPYEAVGQLADLLVAGGYLKSKPQGLSNTYTQAVADGLKAYQADQGLKDDGIIGPSTLQSLNKSPKAKVDSIALNLNRARLLPDELGSRHVMVNLPGGMVYAMDRTGSKPALTMKVVYGEASRDRQTALFHDQMEYVVFRPYWRIPQEIAVKEIVPKAQGNLGYLAKKGYTMVSDYNGENLATNSSNFQRVASGSLKMRQEPGGQNSLGLVKFLFPNEHAIYLHDTPADTLFSQSKRDFSHGCVRLEKPAEMADWVLNDPKWNPEKIKQAMSTSGKNNQSISLKSKINVYLAYFTAFPAPGSRDIRYYDDVYDLDKRDAEIIANGN